MKQKAESTGIQKKRKIVIEDCSVSLSYKAGGPSLELLLRKYLENSLNDSSNL